MFFLRKITFKITFRISAYSSLHHCQTKSRNEERVGESEKERKRESCESCAPELKPQAIHLQHGGVSEKVTHSWTLVAFLHNSQLNCAILSTSWEFFHTVEFETVIFCYTCKFHYDTRGRQKFECHQYSRI